MPKQKFFSAKLLSGNNTFLRRKNNNVGVNPYVLLNYISDLNFKKIKSSLKETIRKLKSEHLLPILKQVNSKLKTYAAYYNFADNSRRMSYLKYYIDRCF